MKNEVARVHSINVSRGGVPKMPVSGAEVALNGLDADAQNDLEHHGGPDRAVCLFSLELIEALRREGHPIAPGSAGENLTVSGLDWARISPGSVLAIGDVTLEVTAYAPPCKTIRGSFVDANFNRINHKKHAGWSRVYAKVIRGGPIRTGDAVHPRSNSRSLPTSPGVGRGPTFEYK